ncbi:lasso peptide biosynthesis PqqD family chaperone [Streptomyces silvisoli]|uniref:Lasso peptide biosynthesis PqqD family chaperone n=1 Tax=Streptomyces silvisoli TaxID=3034235 RepID=A0ABT5ZLD1_9ACTN|nr:lasso peptide biosynthesis PqqD family chaperone [Streptomyces silvisoli]MDF3290638.1 lasso peptide biosynthesis PqqD family chaperone [Streptomyces silvisoli]
MTLRLTAHTVTTETDDGAVLLSQRTGDYWQVNHTGAYALQCLLAGHTVEQVAEEFAARYDIAPAQAREDLTALTDQLRSSGLVEAD